MNDDDIKQLWKQQHFESKRAMPDEEQIAVMKTRMKRFDKTIRFRDYREIAACGFIVLFFGRDLFFGNNSAMSRTGDLVLVGSAILIAWKLTQSKSRAPNVEPNAPILDTVNAELLKVENQIGLLTSIGWWYLLPLFAGVTLQYWGRRVSFPFKLSYSAVIFAVFALIYWLNQCAVKAHLLPLKRKLETLLDPPAIAADEELDSR